MSDLGSGTGGLSTGGTGPLFLPQGPAGTGKIGRAQAGAAEPRAFHNDEAAAQSREQGAFSPAQLDFGASLKQAAHQQGIHLLERLMDADPAGWQALLERSSATERDQAAAFLASQRDGSLRDQYLDAFSELVTNLGVLSGSDARQAFAEVLDEMDRGLQKLGAEPGPGGDLHFEDEPF